MMKIYFYSNLLWYQKVLPYKHDELTNICWGGGVCLRHFVTSTSVFFKCFLALDGQKANIWLFNLKKSSIGLLKFNV